MKMFIILACLLVAGCHKDQPPAPTAEQSAELNDAEDMLNNMSSNEEGPEAKAPDPSNSND